MACDAEMSRSPRAHRAVAERVAPGPTCTVATRSSVGFPGRNAAGVRLGAWAVAARPPPPEVGTQPMNGRKLVVFRSAPAYAPVKTTLRPVVTPGATGL